PLRPHLRAPDELDAYPAHRAGDLPPAGAELDEDAQLSRFDALRRDQEAARRAADARARGLLASFERRIADGTGGELVYHVGGASGPTIAIVNAIGQGLHYWGRVMDELMGYHRLIIWEA